MHAQNEALKLDIKQLTSLVTVADVGSVTRLRECCTWSSRRSLDMSGCSRTRPVHHGNEPCNLGWSVEYAARSLTWT